MTTIGQQIREARKQKGLTQEQLAEKVDRNLRTIQRIENSENTPRNETLFLICKELEISLEEEEKEKKDTKEIIKQIAAILLNIGFLIVLNLTIMTMFGYLTIDSNTSTNSRVGAMGLGFLLAHFINSVTPKMTNIERLVKFGTGVMIYIIIIWKSWGFPFMFVRMLTPSILVYLCMLFYGNEIMALLKTSKEK